MAYRPGVESHWRDGWAVREPAKSYRCEGLRDTLVRKRHLLYLIATILAGLTWARYVPLGEHSRSKQHPQAPQIKEPD